MKFLSYTFPSPFWFSVTNSLQYDTKWFHIQPERLTMSLQAQATRRSSEDRLDAILHALSDRTRRAMLKRLASGPATVGELAKPIAMTRVAVSKHLRVLENARLVSRTIDGRVHRCALRSEPLQEVERWLAGYRAFWTEKLEALARFAEEGDRNNG
jgi:DNA-binding transcriptional ArsR family regulator